MSDETDEPTIVEAVHEVSPEAIMVQAEADAYVMAVFAAWQDTEQRRRIAAYEAFMDKAVDFMLAGLPVDEQ